jgi:hypothetical protein
MKFFITLLVHVNKSCIRTISVSLIIFQLPSGEYIPCFRVCTALQSYFSTFSFKSTLTKQEATLIESHGVKKTNYELWPISCSLTHSAYSNNNYKQTVPDN